MRTTLALLVIFGCWLAAAWIDGLPCHAAVWPRASAGEMRTSQTVGALCGNWMCNSDADCGSTCRCWYGPTGVGRCR